MTSINQLPKHIQNLINEFNCEHRESLAPSLACIQEHRKCLYCNFIIHGVKTIYPGIRFFCGAFCQDEWDHERRIEEYANRHITPVNTAWIL